MNNSMSNEDAEILEYANMSNFRKVENTVTNCA